MSRLIRVRDLPVTPAYGVVLHCDICHADYSATKGDYFINSPDLVFRCCGRPNRLVQQSTVYKNVKVSA